MRRRPLQSLAAGPLLALVAAACGARPPPAPEPPPAAGVEHDVCEGSPPIPHAPLSGILRNARCDQDMYWSMSHVADSLGVDCTYCHAPKAGDTPAPPGKAGDTPAPPGKAGDTPAPPGKALKEEGKPDRDFPVMTPRKEIANWMSMHLMAAIKPADGSPLHCASCHTDEDGKPVAKILGSPRDKVKANEWMSLTMVRKFVAADGSKLRCKSCHAGTPGTAGFRPTVILQTEQIPKHEVAARGTPGY